MFRTVVIEGFHVVVVFQCRVERSRQEFVDLHTNEHVPVDIDVSELITIRSEKIGCSDQAYVFRGTPEKLELLRLLRALPEGRTALLYKFDGQTGRLTEVLAAPKIAESLTRQDKE